MTINKALAMQLIDLQHRLQEAEGVVAQMATALQAIEPSAEPRPFKVGDEVEGRGYGNPETTYRGRFLGFAEGPYTPGAGLIEDPGSMPWYVERDSIRLIAPVPQSEPSPRMCSEADETAADPTIPAMPVMHRGKSPWDHIYDLEAYAHDLERRLGEAEDKRERWMGVAINTHTELDAARAEVARLQEENTRERDEQGRLRDDLRAMTEAMDNAVSEATRHFETVLSLQAQVQTLAEALKKTKACAIIPDYGMDVIRAALASLEVKP